MTDPLSDAARAARRGELIVFPTDTVYGIATRPDDAKATLRLFEAKGRSPDLELPVLVGSAGAARELAVFDQRAERLAGSLWPGAITIVLPRAPASRGWPLGGDPESIGVRVPHHALALALLALAGPLAVTSANRSGESTASDCDGIHKTFGDLVAVYLCEERPLEGVPSTVVDLTARDARVLRPGGIDAETLGRLLNG